MKKFNSGKLISLFVLFSCALQAMERPDKPAGAQSLQASEGQQEPSLFVFNKTPQKIQLVYQYKVDEKPKSGTLIKNQDIKLIKPMDLQLVQVVPYGQWSEWVSAQAVTGDLIKAENLMERVNEKLALAKPGQNISLEIKPGGSTWLGAGVLGRVAGGILPFTPDISLIGEPETEPSLVIDKLPQVKEAYNAGKPILPRYFLSVGERASDADIKAAYDQLMKEFSAEKERADDVVLKGHFDDLMSFVQIAHDALILRTPDATAKFQKMVEEETDIPTMY